MTELAAINRAGWEINACCGYCGTPFDLIHPEPRTERPTPRYNPILTLIGM
ncbi:hypothetical protein M0R72_06650 [Candidatus Pacearchaeota archaeon]|jgi:hypothetical protein|nr:hypothetical protein [Candidatus Pacearchaeota archaeon]